MASSLPGISAIGECCEIDGQTWGLVAPCLRQAEVLADRLCGAPGEGFVWQDAGTRLKVTGIEFFCAGEQQAGEQDDIYTSWDPIDRHYRRLLLRDGRLRGVLLMGDCTAAAALTARLESDEPATVDWLFDPSSTQPQAAGIMTMTKPVLVLVGHGMVGHHFLGQCVSRNLHQQYRIVVFGEERYPAYDRVHLSEYFAGRSAESLSLAAGDFFIEHGIELRLGEAVATIDREARLVRDAEGHEIHWDKLVLATGSYPFVPPIPGNDLAGCFVYRTLDDLDRIAAHAAAAKTGVVIGGGLLGLEAANALKQLGLEAVVTADADTIRAADRLILPGVGAFADAMAKLEATGLVPVIKTEAEQKPLLGICLGMQLLFEKSYEYGEHAGLGFVKGEVCPLEPDLADKSLKVPQIGWNALHIVKDDPLFQYIREGEYVYYVHSYYGKNCAESTLAVSDYSIPVTGAVRAGKVYGTQFHPEKSGDTGLRILKAFSEL